MKPHLLLTVMLLACSPSKPLAGDPAAEQSELATEDSMDGTGDAAGGSGQPVSGLPFSHGKSFRTLDGYLAHLRQYAAPIDQPWWREIRPGVYEHVTRMPGAQRETATRAELMERFGFSS